VPGNAKKRLEWSKRSSKQLLEVEIYIEADNPAAALAVVDYILAAAERLISFPLSGKLGRGQGVREVVLTRYPYTLFYRIYPTRIQVLRVLHQRRKFP